MAVFQQPVKLEKLSAPREDWMRYSPLLTDLYELTMLAGYLDQGMTEKPAVFDLFFRTNPFQGGYAVFAGLAPALEYLEGLHFKSREIEYLQGLGLFQPRFLEFLKDFRFQGQITAPPEGTLVFANEPLVTVEGTLAEAQFVETALLNIINFQTLIATKSARICHAAQGAEVIEFGLRRAQGPDGGLSASRAACVGGATGTSNVLAGMDFDLLIRGTHAHSWIQAFPDELSAFRAYASVFPESSILLVDTYDTLRSGIPNAIIVAKELREKGHELRGIRLDSGDLAYLSHQARLMLDRAGFNNVKILASNELDEHVIESVRSEQGRVDIYGVGTRLVTADGPGGGALGGVYKLVMVDGQPKLKLTSDIAKATLPGKKRIFRILSRDGDFIQDVIGLDDDNPQPGEIVFDPANPLQHTMLPDQFEVRDLRMVVMAKGRRNIGKENLSDMAERCRRELNLLPQGCLRLKNPHRYKVSISENLKNLRGWLIDSLDKQRSEK